MKLIIAIIRADRLGVVQEALKASLDEGDNYRLTVDSVEGHGRQQGRVEYFRGHEVRAPLVNKTRIMIGVNDEYVQPAIDAIVSAARSEEQVAGDGKIFVLPIEQCVRIRTGEIGGEAI